MLIVINDDYELEMSGEIWKYILHIPKISRAMTLAIRIFQLEIT